ncbi:uncharacterized protein LOC120844531, partial [Ixodes scapularis]|uniref:uncharacterized protein LOC120844531 n=1 Tax=Ixodes scapularis TaxID=6945 RepID=UPI001A9D00E1
TGWQMSLNADKCMLLFFHRRTNPMSFVYRLNSFALTSCTSYKYLGVYLTLNLSWSTHIEHLIKSTNRSLGFLKRNLKSDPHHLKLLAFKTLVHPKLEFASSVWDPHQSYLSSDVEAIQNRAVRFIHSNYSYNTSVTALKKQDNLQDLSIRRKITRLLLFHKLFNDATKWESYIQVAAERHLRNYHPHQVIPAKFKTTTFMNSFFVKTAKDWNDLPRKITSLADPLKFKTALLSFF